MYVFALNAVYSVAPCANLGLSIWNFNSQYLVGTEISTLEGAGCRALFLSGHGSRKYCQ